MSVFGNYAHYYDLCYHDKDYAAESGFIRQLLQHYAPAARSLLELGSGTGRHAERLAQAGYRVHGVDRSAIMLQQAQQRRAHLMPEVADRLEFSHGDIRTVHVHQTFDAIISLFHVLSYQTTNDDVVATFGTMKHHLNPGGLVLFDFWYGPAVLTDRPGTRIKRFEDDSARIVRLAEATMSPNENLVHVHYDVLIEDKATHHLETLEETHVMRYFFYPELDFLLKQAGLRIITGLEWMRPDAPLSFESWNGMLLVSHYKE